MKLEQNACILIPNLAGYVYSTAKVGIKMHALSLCFISAVCFSAFYCTKIPNFCLYLLIMECTWILIVEAKQIEYLTASLQPSYIPIYSSCQIGLSNSRGSHLADEGPTIEHDHQYWLKLSNDCAQNKKYPRTLYSLATVNILFYTDKINTYHYQCICSSVSLQVPYPNGVIIPCSKYFSFMRPYNCFHRLSVSC